MKMIVPLFICFTTAVLSGCQTLANIQAHNEAQAQAFQARLDALTPQQKNALQRCSSIAVGKLTALQNANQYHGWIINSNIVNSCLDNPYYYETIPIPTVVIQKEE